MLGESEKSPFYLDDICFTELYIFFVLVCASLFLAFFLLYGQVGGGDRSERYCSCIKETWGRGKYAFSLWGVFSCQCAFQVWTEISGRKWGWSLFQCQSWIQKQLRRRLNRSCRINKIAFYTRSWRVGGSLIIQLILLSCTCMNIGLCLVPRLSTCILVYRRRPSLRT